MTEKHFAKLLLQDLPCTPYAGLSYSYFSCSRSWKAFIFAWRLFLRAALGKLAPSKLAPIRADGQ
jgi:hypothetical protein